MKPWHLRPAQPAQQWRWASQSPARMMGAAPAEKRPNGAGVSKRLMAVAALCLLPACFPPEDERLSCDDVYAPGSFDYRALENLIVQDGVGTSKGCLGAPCHSAATQRGGVRLDTPELIYDELSTRPETYYEALASAYMPHDGIPWDDEDLKIFRSWYCAGAFPP